jgi:hypothetical protein
LHPFAAFFKRKNCLVPSLRKLLRYLKQGCQMVCFQTKNPDLGKKIQGFILENVDIFYGRLEYFKDSFDIL